MPKNTKLYLNTYLRGKKDKVLRLCPFSRVILNLVIILYLFHVHGKSKYPLILVKSVFLIKLGAAAVGADSVLTVVNTQYRLIALRKLIVVGCVGQFLCGVR